ncbi:asparaginase family protein [Talaromyces marneffei ATCC 18224]|uniref:Asparaginase family protein n=1 Tax=Talaromyces marneffei (strain ATCC 18224 / CBS 334.59 / QM 7333) TaxID=441960 RepID=B6Q5H2_TALMQ|nr:asparaginase family protein [Talaromyces marneffei ATCC 18224]
MSPRLREAGDIYAIYVHAGAGFHSYQNENVHLKACNDAAKVAMSMLKNGASALDAVEIALRLMEDREITNAGYGSNLTMEGNVECDATIVDHLGRSGAVGACSHVRNPISAARVILNAQDKQLSLQRVPPNFLVSKGATEFAYLHGLPIVENDFLVSPTAKARWLRWQQEVEAAGQEQEARNTVQTTGEIVHMETATSTASFSTTVNPAMLMTPPSDLHGITTLKEQDTNVVLPEPTLVPADGAHHINERVAIRPKQTDDATSGGEQSNDNVDTITDTIGAIAVDSYGRIAAGSSSGGIGMKHSGRVGPAALVGIGTAVIPEDPQDPEQTSVATVTSGTGEHIATTLAASTCASRIYYSDRKDESGMTENVTEEEAIKSMVDVDFMGHPSVKHSHCEAAIGIMAVKKTMDGVYLFFCHNTDSFVCPWHVLLPKLISNNDTYKL